MDTFNFCPDRQVVINVAPDPLTASDMNGWTFTSKPTIPYQKKFKLNLYGLTWFLNDVTGFYDTTTKPKINARALELFYETHGVWNPFLWKHPHLGFQPLLVRFNAALNLPAGDENSAGLIGSPVEVNLIHHNPSY